MTSQDSDIESDIEGSQSSDICLSQVKKRGQKENSYSHDVFSEVAGCSQKEFTESSQKEFTESSQKEVFSQKELMFTSSTPTAARQNDIRFGVDCRGVKRGRCRECGDGECVFFEPGADSKTCGYCLCNTTKHMRLNNETLEELPPIPRLEDAMPRLEDPGNASFERLSSQEVFNSSSQSASTPRVLETSGTRDSSADGNIGKKFYLLNQQFYLLRWQYFLLG